MPFCARATTGTDNRQHLRLKNEKEIMTMTTWTLKISEAINGYALVAAKKSGGGVEARP